MTKPYCKPHWSTWADVANLICSGEDGYDRFMHSIGFPEYHDGPNENDLLGLLKRSKLETKACVHVPSHMPQFDFKFRFKMLESNCNIAFSNHFQDISFLLEDHKSKLKCFWEFGENNAFAKQVSDMIGDDQEWNLGGELHQLVEDVHRLHTSLAQVFVLPERDNLLNQWRTQ